MPSFPVVLLNQQRPERADAARNRQTILDAAQKIVAETGEINFSMDELAKAAGVGKGTIFRRFENRQGVLDALLHYSAQQFQRDFMSGPPPLGPGVPARERLLAFGEADIAFTRSMGALAVATADRFRNYYGHPVRQLISQHLAMLLREAGLQGDVDVALYQLVTYLNPGGLDYLQSVRGVSPERLNAGWVRLVNSLLGQSAWGLDQV